MSKVPTCKVQGSAGETVIRQEDLKSYESRGYKLIKGSEKGIGASHEAPPTAKTDLYVLTVAELKAKAEFLNVELESGARKDEIIAAIEDHHNANEEEDEDNE